MPPIAPPRGSAWVPKAEVVALCGGLVAANLAAWGWAWWTFGDRAQLMAAAVLAYVFGLRHAFDADHIAAIDNAVRKLMQERKRPFAVGLYFALGHSAVVIAASVVIAVATAALQRRFGAWLDIVSVTGSLVSAAFLLVIAIANLLVLRDLWSALRRSRDGTVEDPRPTQGGFITRLLRPVLGVITRPWHMLLVGLLFGLSFDTATEIGVFGLAARQAGESLPLWSVLIFPVLFAAGMALMDTLDSVLMTGIYGWAFVTPLRKLWYNTAITALSVAVAVVVGGADVLDLLREKLGLSFAVPGIGDLGAISANFGFVVVALLVAVWGLSVAIGKSRARAIGAD